MTRTAYVYILASKRHGTLYTGVTTDLHRRMFEHQNHLVDGFTKNYDVTRLVWFVAGDSMTGALELEKKIKNRGRQWKIDLIEKSNPQWRDLSEDWMDPATPLRSALRMAEEGVPCTPPVNPPSFCATSQNLRQWAQCLRFAQRRTDGKESHEPY